MGPSRLMAQQGFHLSRQGEARTQRQAVVGSGTSDRAAAWLRFARRCRSGAGQSCSLAGAAAPRPPSCPSSLWPGLLCHGTGETSPNPLPTSVHLLYVLFFPPANNEGSVFS